MNNFEVKCSLKAHKYQKYVLENTLSFHYKCIYKVKDTLLFKKIVKIRDWGFITIGLVILLDWVYNKSTKTILIKTNLTLVSLNVKINVKRFFKQNTVYINFNFSN